MVANTREILDTPASHEHHRVLLQVVSLTRDVGRNLYLVGQPDSGDLAQSRVRLLRRRGPHLGADAPTLRGSPTGLRSATLERVV